MSSYIREEISFVLRNATHGAFVGALGGAALNAAAYLIGVNGVDLRLIATTMSLGNVLFGFIDFYLIYFLFRIPQYSAEHPAVTEPSSYGLFLLSEISLPWSFLYLCVHENILSRYNPAPQTPA